MITNKISLDVIQVASPCTAPWDEMQGDDRVRFCGQCRLNVYNLSEMPREEAQKLVANHEGRLCVRFYRRADGTVLTRDCPVGLRALRIQLGKLVAATAAMIVALISGTIFARQNQKGTRTSFPPPTMEVSSPLEAVHRWIGWQNFIRIEMGDVCPVPTVRAAPTPTPVPAVSAESKTEEPANLTPDETVPGDK